MAYTPLPVISPGDTGTSGWANTVKSNFDASAVAIVTTKGDLPVATGATSLARLAVGANRSGLVADALEATGMKWTIRPACRVYNNANITPAYVWESLTFNSERFDTNDMHSTIANTSRITIPANGDGLYLVGGCVDFATGGGAGEVDIGVRVLLENTTVLCEARASEDNDADHTVYTISCPYEFVAGNWIELQVYSPVTISYYSAFSPEFWAVWMGPPTS